MKYLLNLHIFYLNGFMILLNRGKMKINVIFLLLICYIRSRDQTYASPKSCFLRVTTPHLQRKPELGI